ncbi:hypothetical protein D3C81_980200 [compost metagenome]|uniref:Uncharacterized protein n=1 Tax=Cupriavidus campinensis TaxID=151783 RepID=A0AAE9HVW7_9BURK|nr:MULTISPECIES: hypothetical protein [Cupriavidus]TSP10108.1 hypothetical protein FGG12_24390 [Cupriavidus campinensis]URF03077.1 hypothetical protein M5D45_10995 [Cupriavidus campinensis]CAG2156279.1 hypothetical protein LMG19282_05171 [Cupriavidus campinensis]
MAKRERSRRVIMEEVSRRVQQIDEIADEGRHIQVPDPQPHPRDGRGRNWDMARFGNARGFEAAIRNVVDDVRDEFDLTDEPVSSVPNPFGD